MAENMMKYVKMDLKHIFYYYEEGFFFYEQKFKTHLLDRSTFESTTKEI